MPLAPLKLYRDSPHPVLTVDGDVTSSCILQPWRKPSASGRTLRARSLRPGGGAWAEERNAPVSGYMSVGELAELVGVTVRSIQYYDQQGILSPTAKGPQNQRLYALADVERLYCILCLKYVGLSLAQIRACLSQGVTLADARRIFLDALADTENAFSTLLGRYATLRCLAESVGAEVPAGDLADRTAATPGAVEVTESPAEPAAAPDWRSLAQSIERYQEGGKYFWRLSCVRDEEGEQDAEPAEKDRVVGAWHGLISDTLTNMSAGEPPDSERSQAIAERYLRLLSEDAVRPDGRAFLLLENAPVSRAPGEASFDAMRRSVSAYLERLAACYRELHPA